MSEQENVAILQQAYEYWNENREQAFKNWMDLMSEDVRFRSLADGHPGMEFTRSCDSKNDVLRYFEELASEWEMVYFKMDEFIAQGDRVVAIGQCHWRHVRTGKDIETLKVDIFTMRDSKIVDVFELYDTKKAIDATE
ncbi:MAG: nuclear transport factor 2 family protein [Pseudomonadota bacterium]